jgi:hypothetical protein
MAAAIAASVAVLLRIPIPSVVVIRRTDAIRVEIFLDTPLKYLYSLSRFSS